MSRKPHPEHVSHERWLVSYADFITLLFAFFVVLFASSQSDKKKQAQLAAAMQVAFSPAAIFQPHAKKPALTEDGSAAVEAIVSTVSIPKPADHATAALRKTIVELAKSATLPSGSMTMRTTSEGLVISLKEAGFFTSGSAEVQVGSRQILMQLAAALPAGPMRVEGHTDTVPIHTSQFATNWELSSQRAITIARYLIEDGPVNPRDLAVTGYAEFHPVASNATEEGRAKNRRVDIILLSHPTPSQ